MQGPITHLLVDKFDQAFAKAFPGVRLSHPIEVVRSSNPAFGHYQCNSAMKWAKQLSMAPISIAKKLIAEIDRLDHGKPFIASLEGAGPGFINISLDYFYIARKLDLFLKDPRLGIPLPKKKMRIIVEFSSPNVAKEMHVGHIRSTIIGDCIARLMEFLGHDVVRLNHIGDWGTQFGMLIAYLQERHNDFQQENPSLPQLMQWYKKSKALFDQDPAFKKRAQEKVVALQSEDPQAIQAWQTICQISRLGYQEIYDLLDVVITERGESFYNPYLRPLIRDLENKGMLASSDGAKCLFLEGFKNRQGDPMPMILQKSDGGFNYATTDLAAFRHRLEVEKADRIIVATDSGQSLHFQMLEKAAAACGFYDPKKARFDHVTFGLVLGPDGKKFKTRSGETEKLIDVLIQAVEQAKKILLERKIDLSPQEIEHTALILGIDAVKYADLACMRTNDYLFSYEKMLRFEGNTAAFLLYAYVRIASIKRKIGCSMEDVQKTSHILLQHPCEQSLGLHLLQFGEILGAFFNDLYPHRLAEYLFELAEKFHAFFRDCRVEGDEHQNERLLLCDIAARTLKQGLEILGLRVIERM